MTLEPIKRFKVCQNYNRYYVGIVINGRVIRTTFLITPQGITCTETNKMLSANKHGGVRFTFNKKRYYLSKNEIDDLMTEFKLMVWSPASNMKQLTDWFSIEQDKYDEYISKGYIFGANPRRVTWWMNDKLHREDGPAAIYVDGKQEWWLNGVQYSESEYHQQVAAESFVIVSILGGKYSINPCPEKYNSLSAAESAAEKMACANPNTKYAVVKLVVSFQTQSVIKSTNFD